MAVINVAEEENKNDERINHNTDGFVVKVRGVIATKVNGYYYADTSNKVSIKFDIILDGETRVDIDQIVLKIPLNLIFKGECIAEMYLDVAIIAGAFTISGKFTTPGKWVLDFDCVNQSLKSIDSDWKLSGDKITFLV